MFGNLERTIPGWVSPEYATPGDVTRAGLYIDEAGGNAGLPATPGVRLPLIHEFTDFTPATPTAVPGLKSQVSSQEQIDASLPSLATTQTAVNALEQNKLAPLLLLALLAFVVLKR